MTTTKITTMIIRTTEDPPSSTTVARVAPGSVPTIPLAHAGLGELALRRAGRAADAAKALLLTQRADGHFWEVLKYSPSYPRALERRQRVQGIHGVSE